MIEWIWQVFWLVSDPASLPIRQCGQWFGVCRSFSLFLSRGSGDTYSYGDSAGITPDFPFNDAGASTSIGANVVLFFFPAWAARVFAAQRLQQAGNAVIFCFGSIACQSPGGPAVFF